MNKRIKCLHIVYPEKFFKDYIEFVNRNFNPEDHIFLYLKTNGTEPQADNVLCLKYYRWGLLFYYELYQYVKRSDRMLLHSLLKNKVIYFLFIFSRFRKKSMWYLWGGDMYYRIEKFSKPIHNWLYQLIFKKVVSGLGCAVTHIAGDVELARKLLGYKGQHIHCFLYPSNYFKPVESVENNQKPASQLLILVGNSAHESNNHLDVFEKLQPFKNSIQVVCPLSYGNKKYAALVKQEGQLCFGENFRALDSFMPLVEYVKILKSIDIAIFNNWRQQGVGNIINLLGLGKTIYLRSDTTTWAMLQDYGLKACDFCAFGNLGMLQIEALEANKHIVQRNFNEENLKSQSEAVFTWAP